MAQKFLDLFREIKLDTSLQTILEKSEIIRISDSKDHSLFCVYIKAPVLIPKRKIWELEGIIKKQYFSNSDKVTVRVKEKFDLTDSYTPRRIYSDYRDSILEEIRAHNMLLFQLLTRADTIFDDDSEGRSHMTLVLEDTMIAHEQQDQLYHILDKILCERCGSRVIIDISYKETEDKLNREKAEEEIKKRVQAIGEQLDNASEEGTSSDTDPKDASSDDKKVDVSKSSDKTKTGGKKSFYNPSVSENPYQKKTRAPIIKDPNLLYGKAFSEEAIDISDITGEYGECVVRGQIIFLDFREIRGERTIITFHITDFTDTIACKIFSKNEYLDSIKNKIHNGDFIKLKGEAEEDRYDKEVVISRISGITSIPSFKTERMDTEASKRVELHCHTKMSDMDGVSDVKDIIKMAKKWGHKALAITDHGVVQSFPDADHAVSGDDDFKVIYGCEIYLVDDEKKIASGDESIGFDHDFVVFDIETTGLNAASVQIIEIGAVKFSGGEITDRFSVFVKPTVPIPYRIVEITGITDQMVADADPIEVVLPKFREFCGDSVLVAHNADFDTGCVRAWCNRLGIDWDFTYVDTVPMSRFLLPGLSRFKLDQVAKELGVELIDHHRAVNDAECTAHIFEKFIIMLSERNISTLGELNDRGSMTESDIRKAHANHCIVLAKNDMGRINLYKIVSESHLKYFSRTPKIPKSYVNANREGLIIGSACEAGELFQAILTGKDDAQIARIVSFYDYLEIQPDGNNAFLVGNDKFDIKNYDDLHEINRRIVTLGEDFNKPVVATCDVHFLNPEDEVYRRIIMASKKFKDADDQAPLYLHTTGEMLDEFAYLGSEKAREVVITAPNLIADMCEKICPTRPDKCPPVIDNSDGLLREICYSKAHEMYGEDLPEVVVARLERELNSIISNGYAVMYIIAQKLVWKSVEDGYLVGSRGSVGSSFVATMAGITEVNPLSPHYLCRKCHYVDFDSDEVKQYAGRAGCDMPDKVCPVCGEPLSKEGFDIPFETFLGFKGDKEPDIDLNFSGDYQNKAHRYTEVIFGEGQTFRAGTIGTLADKTAYGYIMHYFEERGVHKRSCEVERLVSGCVGVRRTTGQHPGGIIVLPVGEEICSFTPVQHPANDMTTDIITTHFDYHSIDANLLKLDILGHDDPTMIRRLEDLTGIDATTIPLDAPEVMELFLSTEPLGVKPEDLWNVDRGTLGIPEFGTDFAMGMLRDAGPREFSDLVRISGLSHGTDVWLGNAQTLIAEGKATISTAICTRDDIMTYLIGMGLDSEESFKIMENVRKGKIAKGGCKQWPDWKQDMIDHKVPDWYIWSCEKIKYMFPKAHAVAYVMMAWRIAWFKIHYPLEYYAAFFSIRATNFDYEIMCQGQEHLEDTLNAYDEMSARGEKLSAKQEGAYRDMRIVQEMYARGYTFLPLDIYKSDARYFTVHEGKLLPPLNSIEGMGDKAAETLAIAASRGTFMSKNDIKERGKVSGTIIEKMDRMHLLGNLPESDQLSVFDILNGAIA